MAFQYFQAADSVNLSYSMKLLSICASEVVKCSRHLLHRATIMLLSKFTILTLIVVALALMDDSPVHIAAAPFWWRNKPKYFRDKIVYPNGTVVTPPRRQECVQSEKFQDTSTSE